MITGINFKTGIEVEGIVLTSEQYDIPFASAKIGGTQPTTTIPMMPVGLLVAGMISAGLSSLSGNDISSVRLAPIEISVVPSAAVAARGSNFDLKQAYEQLRQQMVSEGIPFLNPEELDHEIADRKGNRS
ncbi:MAG TPA: hypothetical protein VKR43_00795 [Bryobacteraceae bacterium]|nr:hypothetical protein [Bryobacteraceae bacterium]